MGEKLTKKSLNDPKISIVIPVYNEEDNVKELVLKISSAFQNNLKISYELIIIDDGSNDDTATILKALAKGNKNIRPVFLVRNYGQSTALQAGFDQACGDFIVTMDGDLQNDHQDIALLIKKMEEEKADMISGWRKERHDGFLRVIFSKIANKIICRILGLRLHDLGCSLKIYRTPIIKRIRLYGELHRFIPALIHEVGGKIIEMEVTHHPRKAGKSNYGLDRTFRVLLDLLLIVFLRRYLHRPIHFFGGIGMAFGIAGGMICIYLLGLKIILGVSIGGRPLLLFGVVLCIGALILMAQGLTAEILIRVLHEGGVKPQYVRIKEKENLTKESIHDKAKK